MLRAHITDSAIYIIDTRTNEILEILDPASEENRKRAAIINGSLIEAKR